MPPVLTPDLRWRLVTDYLRGRIVKQGKVCPTCWKDHSEPATMNTSVIALEELYLRMSDKCVYCGARP